MTRRFSSPTGIALPEVLVAMLVLIVGLVATAHLLAISTAARAAAGAVTVATLEAQEKLDDLRGTGFSAPALQIQTTDSLNADVANHADRTATGRTRRWRVDAGPVADTRLVRVRVLNPQAREGAHVDLISIVRRQ